MTPVNDLSLYLERMEAGLEDKLFFIDECENVKHFLDFGCANGVIIEVLSKIFPDAKFYGFDANQLSLDIARSKNIRNAMFSDDIDSLMEELYNNCVEGEKSAIILSSVVHEVMSMATYQEMGLFWKFIKRSDFTYIVIRDMAISANTRILTVPHEDVTKVKQKADKALLESFTQEWGSISGTANFIHFLLKYPYKENWATEIKENYMVNLEVLESATLYKRSNPFSIIHYDYYMHPYIKERVKKDFDVDLTFKTHIKMILYDEFANKGLDG